jgi:membrane protein YqaA with SNARE-associated domain
MDWLEIACKAFWHELISAIVGVVIGGVAGYRIGVKSKVRQTQKAGDNSSQTQIGSIINNGK